MSDLLLVDRTGHLGVIARISLNRPEVHNAFNAALIGELRQQFRRLADEVTFDIAAL